MSRLTRFCSRARRAFSAGLSLPSCIARDWSRSTRASSRSSFAASRVVSWPDFRPCSMRFCWLTSRWMVPACANAAPQKARPSAAAMAVRANFMSCSFRMLEPIQRARQCSGLPLSGEMSNSLYHRPQMSPPHVIIVGCGFGGLWAAQALRHAPLEVTVVDRTNHHLFTPLLYQVATAGLSAPSVAGPIRHILADQRNTTVLFGEVRAVDLARRLVRLENGDELGYDYLIAAAGTTLSYFGHDEWAPFAPGLKTLEDALEIRRRVLLAFERAERESDPARRAAWLTFVVVGGGATGVELAGTFAEIARHTLRGEFRRIDPHSARVVLVEGASRVLPPYPA